MFINSTHYTEKSHTITQKNIVPIRGNILDVNGRVISTNSIYYDIYMDPNTPYINNLDEAKRNQNLDSLAYLLADLFNDKSKEDYLKLFYDARANNKRYVPIRKKVDYFDFSILKTFPLFRLSKYKGGLIYKKKNVRISFSDSLGRRVIGIKGQDGNYLGVEKIKNKELAGTSGQEKVQVLSNHFYKTLETINEPTHGSDVVTTLDINMQDIIEKILRKRLYELQANSGVAVLMEVETGEIRAMVNLSKVNDSVYGEIDNIAITKLYEPGSVMKLISFMIAFEKDPDLKLDKMINTHNGIWEVNGFKFRDYNYKSDGTGGFGVMPLAKVFELSSNVGTTKIIHSIFKDKSNEFMDKIAEYGFTNPINTGLETEPTPIISSKSKKTMSNVSVRQIAIGYEISITAMHILTFYNAVANSGIMVKPKFIKEIKPNGENKGEVYGVKVLNSLICSKETLEKCKTLLEGVVENGTAKKYVQSDIVKIAGKSGTSQIYSDAQRRYTSDYNTTFVGYFPADKPKYTCLVWINKPKNNKSGSMAAGPVVRKIAEEIYTFDYDLHQELLLVNSMKPKAELPDAAVSFGGFLKTALTSINVPYVNSNAHWVRPVSQSDSIDLQMLKIEKTIMPDVVGMNARDAIFMLEKYKLNIKIDGRGRVISQSIKAGTKVTKNQLVTLKLKI